MNSLDDVAAMTKLDPMDVHGSTAAYADQCEEAWNLSSVIQFSEDYRAARNVVVSGMGGSRFTPRSVKELFFDRITVPYEIVDSYVLPYYVRDESVVILSSYSGTTEETVSCGLEAVTRRAKVTGVAQGGRVQELLQENKFPGYFFSGKYNPCGQPRIGGGYLLMGHIGLLKALGFLSINDQEVTEAICFARDYAKKLLASVPEHDNQAKQLARSLKDTHPFLIASEHLRGFVNGFANQINETAKMISDFRYIPELNHHLMEGLKHPDTLHENGVFVFLDSDLYMPQIRKRFEITKEVVAKQNVKTLSVKLTGPTKLAQVLEGFTLSSFTTFYMAMLYDLDPVAIPWVDYFKQQLAK